MMVKKKKGSGPKKAREWETLEFDDTLRGEGLVEFEVLKSIPKIVTGPRLGDPRPSGSPTMGPGVPPGLPTSPSQVEPTKRSDQGPTVAVAIAAVPSSTESALPAGQSSAYSGKRNPPVAEVKMHKKPATNLKASPSAANHQLSSGREKKEHSSKDSSRRKATIVESEQPVAIPATAQAFPQAASKGAVDSAAPLDKRSVSERSVSESATVAKSLAAKKRQVETSAAAQVIAATAAEESPGFLSAASISSQHIRTAAADELTAAAPPTKKRRRNSVGTSTPVTGSTNTPDGAMSPLESLVGENPTMEDLIYLSEALNGADSDEDEEEGAETGPGDGLGDWFDNDHPSSGDETPASDESLEDETEEEPKGTGESELVEESEVEEVTDLWEDPDIEKEAELAGALPRWIDWEYESSSRKNQNRWAKIKEAAKTFRLPCKLLSNILQAGWTKPTLIQSLSIPAAIVSHDDLVLHSETGSGKTGAFAIPVIHRILSRWMVRPLTKSQRDVVDALVLLPARELAQQVADNFKLLAAGTGIRTCLILGGISIEKQQRWLNQKPHVVVGTVGRLCALMLGEPSLCVMPHAHLRDMKQLKFLLLDEADKLLEYDKLRDAERIVDHIRASNGGTRGRYQVVLCSATIGNVASGTQLGRALGFLGFTQKKTRVISTSATFDETGVTNLLAASMLTNQSRQLTHANSEVRLSLPEGLRVEVCFPPELEKKDSYLLLLLAYLFHHQGEPGAEQTPVKVMIFCNSVESVKRIGVLLQILLAEEHDTVNALKTFRRLRATVENALCGKSKEGVPPAAIATDDNTADDSASDSSASHRPLVTSPPQTAGVQKLQALLQARRQQQTVTATVADPAQPAITVSKPNNKPHASPSSPKRLVLPVLMLHARKKQARRCDVMEKFKRREFSGVLVTTDVAARGIDVPAVDYVVHLQPPVSAQVFVHRSGRTARGTNKEGTALITACPAEVERCNEILKPLSLQLDTLPVWGLESILRSQHYKRANQVLKLTRESVQIAEKIDEFANSIMNLKRMSQWAEVGEPEVVERIRGMMTHSNMVSTSMLNSIAAGVSKHDAKVNQLNNILNEGLLFP